MEFILPNLNCIEKPVVYAIVFNTGYFYIGATTNFEKRIEQHKALIRLRPENYLIYECNIPIKCSFVKLISCQDANTCFKYEKDFILQNSNNPNMINAHYSTTEKTNLFTNKINTAIKLLQ